MQKPQPTFWPHQVDPHKVLSQISAGRSTLDYKGNQEICAQGEAADLVFYIQEGRVKAIVTSHQGKEAIVGIFEEGQFFGEGCLNGQPLRTATMRALAGC